MKKEVWWLVEDVENRGGYNMAFDDYFALHIGKRPLLRFFRWNPYCLSLGYGQNSSIFSNSALRENSIDIVRRPTGGRAVLHAEEVTYSLIIPCTHPLYKLTTSALYRSISRALNKGLIYLGVNSTVEKSRKKPDSLYSSPICFASTARYELKWNGRKLIGSAQRRYSGSVLQHGSIPLRNGDYDIEDFLDVPPRERKGNVKVTAASSVSGALGRDVTYKETVECLKKGFEDTFGISLQRKSVSCKQKDKIKKLSKNYIVAV